MCKKSIRLFIFICLAPMRRGFCILPQGIIGHVLLESNTAMPLKGGSKQKGLPISTMVYIYEAANVNQLMEQEGNYAKGIQARLIKQVRSNNAGKFWGCFCGSIQASIPRNRPFYHRFVHLLIVSLRTEL